MDRIGNIPGGVISEVRNVHSQRVYFISTSPELGEDYWSTVVLPTVHKRTWVDTVGGILTLGRGKNPNPRMAPDVHHSVASFIRNNKDDAYEVHALVKHTTTFEPEDAWLDGFPDPEPPDGFSEGAQFKLGDTLG